MKRCYIEQTNTIVLHTEQNMFTYIQQVCIYVSDFEGGINISEKGILSTEEGTFNTNAKCCIQFCQISVCGAFLYTNMTKICNFYPK